MLKDEWQAWNRPQLRSGQSLADVPTRIDLVHAHFEYRPLRARFDSIYMVFEFISGPVSFFFLVGIENDDTLDGSFVSESPGTADPRLHFDWSKRMASFVYSYVVETEEPSLVPVLKEAVRLYLHLESRPREWEGGQIFTGQPTVDLSPLKKYRSNPQVSVRLISDQMWELTIRARYVTVTASARISSTAEGYHCQLRVLSPRLAIGRNVSFGGSVSALPVSISIPSLLDSIVASLNDEIEYQHTTYNYTDKEYAACLFRDNIPNTYVGKLTVRVSIEELRDSSSVVVENRLFSQLIGEHNILWLKMENLSTKKQMWVIAHPSLYNMPRGEVHVPDVVLANLNCDPGDALHVSIGDLQVAEKEPGTIMVRIRGEARETEDVWFYIEKMSCLCVGSTYAAPSSQYSGVVYFDVLRAGDRGACSLRIDEGGPREAGIEFYTPLIAPENLPVEYDEYSEEESE